MSYCSHTKALAVTVEVKAVAKVTVEVLISAEDDVVIVAAIALVKGVDAIVIVIAPEEVEVGKEADITAAEVEALVQDADDKEEHRLQK